MKKLLLIIGIIVCIGSAMCFSCHAPAAPGKRVAELLASEVNDFLALNDDLLQAVNNNTDEQALRRKFLALRSGYKKFEWAAEYFVPVTSRFVNGPPVQEVEIPEGTVFEPAGLQVIESYLYPRYDTANRKLLVAQVKLLPGRCEKYKVYFNGIDLLDWQVLDALKLEVFRVITLGVTGFDCSLARESVKESAVAMTSLREVLSVYANDDTLSRAINAATKYLEEHPGFDAFDRATFITAYADPVSTNITRLEQRLDLHPLKYNRLLRQGSPTLFDKHAINPDAYVPDYASLASPAKAALGRKLFSDPILSIDGSRSCASCHQPGKAFTDGLEKNSTLDGGAMLGRNTPTLINAALQPLQFYDLRAASLEAQAHAVVHNRNEMRGSLVHVAVKLWGDTAYRKLFAEAFPGKERTTIDTAEITNALAAYERSLVLLNSRFDAYMNGDKMAMTEKELHGFNLFTGKAKCATCHYMPLFNGTLPPRYVTIESEVIGVPSSLKNVAIDTDMGAYNVVRTPSLKHAFKTPTLRNVALTAPYMHNGVYHTLEEVIDFYDKGGGIGLGLPVKDQTLPAEKLNLTPAEKEDIIAFIKSLDSKLN